MKTKLTVWDWAELVGSLTPILAALIFISYNTITGKEIDSTKWPPLLTTSVITIMLVLPLTTLSGFFNTRRHVTMSSDGIAESLKQKISDLDANIKNLRFAKVQTFKSADQYYSYLHDKVSKCQVSWLDMGGFDPELENIPMSNSRRAYYSARVDASKRLSQFYYLGLVRDQEHFRRIMQIVEVGRDAVSSIRCFDKLHDEASKIEVTIVDNEEVIMGYYQPDNPVGQNYVSMTDPSVVSLFKAYYFDLWKQAESEEIKHGQKIFADRVASLESKLAA